MQGLAGVAPAEFLAAGQEPLLKLEIWVGGAWVNLCDLGGENYVQDISISLGGASMTPSPVEGTWSATILNREGVFHPDHPTSAYKDYLKTERRVKISVGAMYGGVPVYWPRIIGYMDVPVFTAPDMNVSISGGDYMKRLKETELRRPTNYWGSSQAYDSIASDGLIGAEIYVQHDAMDTADDGGAGFNNIGTWVDTNCDFASFDVGAGGIFFVGRAINQGPAPVRLNNPNVGAAVEGARYQVKFKHRIVGGTGLISVRVRILQASGICTDIRYWPTDDWKEETFEFLALDTGAIEWRFALGTIDHDLRLDDFSIMTYVPYWDRYYELPGAATGPYYVTLDSGAGAIPCWQGEGDEDWKYVADAEAGPEPPAHPAKIVYFNLNKSVPDGADLGGNNLVIYYFTATPLEDVVARLLWQAGVCDPTTDAPYANEAAAKARMVAQAEYVDPAVDVDMVWFEPGTNCLDAIKKVCERCDYRFYFKYDGAPVFRPKPTWGGADFTFTDPKQIATISTYQDENEIKNRVVIKGLKQSDTVSKEETMPSYLTGEESDAVSIAAYGERTLTIDNYLFQTQGAIDAMKASILAARKDPKWYRSLEIPFKPVPLELGDSLQWEEHLSPTLDITRTGIIRDIKIDNFNTTYKCEIVPIFLDDFKDAARNPSWTDEPNNGTIVEADDVLTLAIANGVHGDFWGATTDGPVCTIGLDNSKNYVITTKLNSFIVNNKIRAGLYITDLVAGTNGISFNRMRRDEAPARDGLTILDMNADELAYVAITTLPIWLKVIIIGSGAGSTMRFYYSTNGADWIYVHTAENETWDKVGLLVWNWGAWSAVSAPFEFFRIDMF